MARSRMPTALLEATARSLREERQFAARLAEERLAYATRQGRAGARFQQRLLKRALSVAGIDYAEIEKRQAQDLKGLRQFVRRQKTAMVDHSRLVARRHRGMIQQLLERRVDQFAPPKAPLVLKLESAADILVETISTQVPAEPPEVQTGTPGQNLVKGVITADGSDHGRLVFILAHFQFIWMSDRDGVLNAIAFVYPNVGYTSYLNPACTGNPQTEAMIDATLYLSQLDSSGKVVLDETSTESLLDTKLEGTDSLGKFNGFNFGDTFPLVYNQQFAIRDATPVLMTLLMTLQISALGGTVQLDFKTGGFALNVPLVYIFAF